MLDFVAFVILPLGVCAKLCYTGFMVLSIILAGLVGFVVGLVLLAWSWVYQKNIQHRLQIQISDQHAGIAKGEALSLRVPLLETQTEQLRDQLGAAQVENMRLQTELASGLQAMQEKWDLFEETKKQLTQTFQSLSSEALYKSNAAFLDLAKASLGHFYERSNQDWEKREQAVSALVSPVQKALENVDQKLQQVEKDRVGAYEGLWQQVRFLHESSQQLKMQTAHLVQSLRSPTVRGRWGEVQLRRIVELAGMSEFCDFEEQVHMRNGDRHIRPDLLVRMPGKKMLVIDAKVPLEAFLKSIEATDEAQKKTFLLEHVAHLRNHIRALSAKSYWEQFESTPEFVVLFLPGDVFFHAALQQDPALLEMGFSQNVIMATPSTLMALLRIVAHGWQQEKMNQTSHEIAKLGRELYTRIVKLAEHFHDVGRTLGQSVKAYNQTLGSLESRVLVTARKFQELYVGPDGKEIAAPVFLEQRPRFLLDPKEGYSLSENSNAAKQALEQQSTTKMGESHMEDE